MNELKHCSRCDQFKPRDRKHFHRNRKEGDGLQTWCKECVREYMREYQREHPEENYERSHQYYEEVLKPDPVRYAEALAAHRKAARERYQKIKKEDPVKYAAFLKKARLRYHARKKESKQPSPSKSSTQRPTASRRRSGSQ